jgi:serine/threonine protein kinase
MNATSQQMAARRYRIERYLTEGGMGAIYVGKKLGPGGFEKDVVLKQLLPEYTSRPEFRDLFFREAKISATLDHANIVHTFDLVESDESLFIVMEYVRGADLRTICRRAKLRRRSISPAAAIQIALEVLAGLSYAHTRRDPSGTSLDIIHRDVSPSNILCSAQGEVKLSDFGIAKASTHSSVFYRVRGKVGYMSPEQARNEAIDARTDLYSLAVCLYEALTAERLFVGDLSTPPDVIYGQPIAPPSQKRRGLPAALDAVMARALAPRPDDRYQDARAFAEALRQVAHQQGLLSSAPQLAEDLREILGSDPNRWLQEDAEPYAAPETQKIQLKALEGREASSIGVVEGSNLYVVSGGDVVSPKNSPAPGYASGAPSVVPSELNLDSLLAGDRDLDRTRKPPKPVPPAADPSFFIPIDEDLGGMDDDDQLTATRETPPPPSAPRRSGNTALPPPPRIAPPPPPAVMLESPFEDEEELGTEEFPLTPPPANAPFYDPGPRGPTYPAPSYAAPPQQQQYAPPAPQPYAPRPGFLPAPYPGAPPAPFTFQAPETIDFGGVQPQVVQRRSGPPGLVILIALLGAAAGGAKLGQLATRGDVAGKLADSSSPGSDTPSPPTPSSQVPSQVPR